MLTNWGIIQKPTLDSLLILLVSDDVVSAGLLILSFLCSVEKKWKEKEHEFKIYHVYIISQNTKDKEQKKVYCLLVNKSYNYSYVTYAI